MTRRLLIFLLLLSPFAPLAFAGDDPDLGVIHQIKHEAFENSKVMDFAFQLTDVYGPRLVTSSGYRRAADWVKQQMQELGLTNIREEPFEFGRGWDYSRFSAHLLEPSYMPLVGFPLAWTAATPGEIVAEAVYAPIETEEDFGKWKGKLAKKVVLMQAPRTLALPLEPYGRRYSAEDLARLSEAVVGGAPQRRASPGRFRNMEEARAFRRKLAQFLHDEQVAAVMSASQIGDGGLVFGSSGGSYDPKDPVSPPGFVVAAEQYNRVWRLLDKKVPVKISLEIRSTITEKSVNAFNLTADLPGGDKKEELVMIGAHFDSWHGGTGATDNAAGTACMLEVIRILRALNLPLRRTVRIALWDAEEEGLLGSRDYVKRYFADRESMQLRPDHARLSAYYNIDNGSGKIRGIYLQGNDMVRPIFTRWLEPFRDLGATTVSVRNTGGTDHVSFDAVGLPGFQFIQDPLDYSARTHHSNMDVYDRLQAEDLKQISAIVASFVYHTAQREEMVPRKPLPKPTPRTGDAAAARATN